MSHCRFDRHKSHVDLASDRTHPFAVRGRGLNHTITTMTRRYSTLWLCGGLVKMNEHQHCPQVRAARWPVRISLLLVSALYTLEFPEVLEVFTFTGNKEKLNFWNRFFKVGNNHKFNYFVSRSKYGLFRWISLVSSTQWKWAESVDLSVSIFGDSNIILCDIMHSEWQ